jgi:hypothetical protein
MTLLLIPFPPTSNTTSSKAQAFNYAAELLAPHRISFDFSKLSTFLTTHNPGTCGAAYNKALTYGSQLRYAFYDLKNYEGMSFGFGNGTCAS